MLAVLGCNHTCHKSAAQREKKEAKMNSKNKFAISLFTSWVYPGGKRHVRLWNLDLGQIFQYHDYPLQFNCQLLPLLCSSSGQLLWAQFNGEPKCHWFGLPLISLSTDCFLKYTEPLLPEKNPPLLHRPPRSTLVYWLLSILALKISIYDTYFKKLTLSSPSRNPFLLYLQLKICQPSWLGL